MRRAGVIALAALCLITLTGAAKTKSEPKAEVEVPPLMLSGGRKLVYERTFSSEREVKLKRGFWTRVFDLVAGAPNYHQMIRPYSVVTD